MASTTRAPGPQPVAAPAGGVTLPPSPEKIQAQFDLAISLLLHLYPPLSLAVSNQWGGPDSADKRDWFAGALSDLFDPPADSTTTTTTQEDVEDRILQVMWDEFEVAVEDESEVWLAADIVRVRGQCERGNFGEVEALWRRWGERRGGNVGALISGVIQGEEGESGHEESESGEDGDEDEVMGGMEDGTEEATRVREKPALEVDEEGFTKVVGRRKR